MKMEISTIDEIVTYLKDNKTFLYDSYGVISLGVFGSYARNTQTISSDIDMVVEFEKDRKDIHSFLRLKRHLEEKLSKKVDLGFEHSLKPIIKEKLKDRIIYV